MSTADSRSRRAPDGDVVAGSYAQALEQTGATSLSMGICERRCTSLKDLAPLAFCWEGTERASSKKCPLCFRPLRRLSRHCWAGAVQILGVKTPIDPPRVEDGVA